MTTMHAYVAGRVQGVYFRNWTRKQAQRLGLHGWVRNLRDGRVEVLAHGRDDMLRELEKLLWQGPPLSRVDTVEITTVAEDHVPTDGFHITPTA